MNRERPSILMVEDSLTQAMRLQNILERNGFAPTVARNGRLALEALDQARPLMVITDIQMPEMDGYELCRRIKSDPARREIPVMLLTSLSSPADIIHGLECCADSFVVKPYEETFLLSRIEAIQARLEAPEEESPAGGVPFFFDSRKYVITSGRRQMLELLISTYEAALHSNQELAKAHEQLKAAQAQIIEAEKLLSVGRLASGVAHEIRNPLAIIEMAATLLSDHAREEDLPVFEEMREAVRRANLVIHGLTDLSAPRQMGMVMTDIREPIESTLASFAEQFTAGRVTLRRDYAGCPCKVRIDAVKMEQAFANIVANARDAMPDGGDLLVSTSVRTLDPGDILFNAGDRSGRHWRAGERVVAIRFSDTGPGVAEENLRRVFDPFFSTKPTGKGIGLGLTVARKVVELHGGSIEIENRPQAGADVTVLLKCNDDSPP